MSDASFAAEIRKTPLAEALGERYLAYALSTIVSRSLPDVRDGLKPVHRRVLYAMQQLKLDPEGGFKKCARVVGDVIGKYHPHGDQSVYDALVRLAQEFAQRYPPVDGQGNFGNVDGDNAAAMRYTEARLTDVATLLLEGIDEDAVDFRPTYDGEEEEPAVLPSNFPNLLANGAAGIAVGMATSIPPHNAAEVCDAAIRLIKRPNASVEDLLAAMPGPDFPTGGVLSESPEAIVEAYKTGRGGFRVRARWEVERLKGGGYQIVVTEIPYQIQKARLIERIAELMAARRLVLLADVRDESAEDVRVVLEPKSRNVDPDVLMESLFRLTDLESRFSLNMNALDAAGTPRVMSLPEMLRAFIDHRREVLLRRSRRRLEKIARRLEILAGYLVAYLNLDEVIRIVREEDEPKAVTMKTFDITEIQADAILNMRLRSLRRLEELEIRREHKTLTEERNALNGLVADEGKQWATITEQIRTVAKQFGPNTALGRRRTEIGAALTALAVPLEAVIEREPVTVLCSRQGWIRGMRGHIADVSDVKYKEGDAGRFVIRCQTTDKLILFASNGRFYTLGADKLPGGRGHGEPVRLQIDLPNEAEIVALLPYRPGNGGEDRPAERFLIASDGGRGFMVSVDETVAQTKNGKQILNLRRGECAALCRVVAPGADSIAVIGENRRLLIFGMEELPEMTRGQGVILQKYRRDTLAPERLRDAIAFRREGGLVWASGAQTRTQTDIAEWNGKRAAVGKTAPSGYTKSYRFA